MIRISLVTFLCLLIGACSSESDDLSQLDLTAFFVEQESSELDFTYAFEGEVVSVEFAFSQGRLEDKPTECETFTTNDLERISKSIEELDLVAALTYTFWIRGINANGKWSDWSHPVSLKMQGFYRSPIGISFTGGQVNWDVLAAGAFDRYELEYGPSGFSVGEGYTLITEELVSSDLVLEIGEQYDVYVRTFCYRGQQWSKHSGPTTYLAEANFNTCLEPYHVDHALYYIGMHDETELEIDWHYSGESSTFDFILVVKNGEMDLALLENTAFSSAYFPNINTEVDYDFYVRTACLDGSFSDWVGPHRIVN